MWVRKRSERRTTSEERKERLPEELGYGFAANYAKGFDMRGLTQTNSPMVVVILVSYYTPNSCT